MHDDAVPDGLVRSDPAGPGLGRRRCGRGFRYLDERGHPIADAVVVGRVKALVLPPAWEDVWICPDPSGHIQAVGTDAAGRRQYRYHDDWTRHRDADKYDRVLRLGARMATVRTELRERLAVSGLGPQRVLAGGVRLLDIGVFRAGGEQYAPDEDDDGTFGLATLRREHVRLHRGAVLFRYPAKGDVTRTVVVRDRPVHRLVNGLLRRRGGGDDLLAYRTGAREWHDVRAEDLNAAVKEVAGRRHTAKDLRTWNGTVLAAVALARLAAEHDVPRSDRRRQRLVVSAMRSVAEQLGNTPAVARASYVDPRVIERFDEGHTVLPTLRRNGFSDAADDAARATIDRAVVRLIRGR